MYFRGPAGNNGRAVDSWCIVFPTAETSEELGICMINIEKQLNEEADMG